MKKIFSPDNITTVQISKKGYINIDIVPTEGADVVMDVSKDLHLIPQEKLALGINIMAIKA